MTKNHLKRLGKDLSGVAGEPCEVEDIRGHIYVFTSELGSLRLFRHYVHMKSKQDFNQGYSQNLKTHYFSVDFSHLKG